MRVDFAHTAQDYATHRAGFPDPLFDRLAAFGAGTRRPSASWTWGRGRGRWRARSPAAGVAVTGLDPAAPMLAQATRLDDEAAVTVDYVVGRAEETGLGAATFDFVTAGQCWHWFDRPRAAAECRRLLVPGGALAICHFDWLPWPGTVAEATERLVLEHNPAWAGAGSTGMYPRWATDVAEAGFGGIETLSFDTEVSYSHEAWRGRVRACAGVAASLEPDAVDAFDAAHASMLQRRFPDDPLTVPHRVWALVARKGNGP